MLYDPRNAVWLNGTQHPFCQKWAVYKFRVANHAYFLRNEEDISWCLQLSEGPEGLR